MKSTPSKEVLSEDRIAEILAKVAQRENPPAEVANAVRARVHQAWQASLQERRGQRRRFTVLASAAGLLLVLGLGLFMQQHTPAPVVLATLGQQLNSVEYRRAGGAWQPVEQGVSPGLLAGDQLRTAAGSFAAFSTEQGLRVRLDQSSELRLLSEREVFLSKGAVYVNAEGESQLTVATAAGIARDIGTKFEVRVMPQGWQVQVRDGQVLIEDKRSGSAVANAGERLQLAADAPPERQAVSAADASWEWTHAVAPAIHLENSSLTEYLRWWSSESGIAFRFDQAISERVAAQTRLHGSIDSLSLEEGFQAVLSSSGYRVLDLSARPIILAR